MYKEVFASRLKTTREYHGITQAEAAKVLKVATSTYTNYEAGKREPNLETVAMLSKLYQVTTDWLLGVSSESGLNSMNQVIHEREREKILKKLDKEAEMNKRVWG
jgi:transcriptional regulator with XRE-family HTH domain